MQNIEERVRQHWNTLKRQITKWQAAIPADRQQLLNQALLYNAHLAAALVLSLKDPDGGKQRFYSHFNNGLRDLTATTKPRPGAAPGGRKNCGARADHPGSEPALPKTI